MTGLYRRSTAAMVLLCLLLVGPGLVWFDVNRTPAWAYARRAYGNPWDAFVEDAFLPKIGQWVDFTRDGFFFLRCDPRPHDRHMYLVARQLLARAGRAQDQRGASGGGDRGSSWCFLSGMLAARVSRCTDTFSRSARISP